MKPKGKFRLTAMHSHAVYSLRRLNCFRLLREPVNERVPSCPISSPMPAKARKPADKRRQASCAYERNLFLRSGFIL